MTHEPPCMLVTAVQTGRERIDMSDIQDCSLYREARSNRRDRLCAECSLHVSGEGSCQSVSKRANKALQKLCKRDIRSKKRQFLQ